MIVMQKFRDYIYSDEEKINLYISQIKEFQKIETSNAYEKDTTISGGLDAKLLNVDAQLREMQTKNYINNVSHLERMVSWSLDDNNAIYFDSNSELNNFDKDKIIVIEGKMMMLEMAENIETLYSLKNNSELFNALPIEKTDENLKILSFIKESDTVPILLENPSKYVISCLIKRSLISNVSDFLDNLDETITVIGKIDRVYNNNDRVEIYDTAKEILKLNRAMRRNFKEEDLKKMVLSEEGPLIKITPIIIYK